jgi:predicted MFS family arabinose efflux permease
MRFAGELVDRWGAAALPAALAAFAVCAALPALPTSGIALAAVLLVVGASSGALDVAINGEAVGAETATRRPLLSLAHAMFSIGVVGASLATGALRTAGAGPGIVLGTMAGLLALATVLAARLPAAPAVRRRRARLSLRRVPPALAVLGALTGLAFMVESAWQNWSAVHLEATLDARAGVAALGPALFAGSAAVGRLAGHRITRHVADGVAVAAGGAVAALGTVLAAAAPAVTLALVGIALAGLGTSVCAPILISRAGRSVASDERGSAVSIVTTIAYLGFLIGPAAVGLLAQATSLSTALAAMAVVACALAAWASRLRAERE